jgi:hypothetical protein
MEMTMRNMKLAALTAVFCLGTAVTVFAQPNMGRNRGPGGWDDLGSVTVDGRFGPPPGRPGRGGMDRDTRSYDLGGPVERLQLRAIGSDINCRSVTARFGNNRNRQVFSGRLDQNRPVNVDLPGDDRNLEGLTFTCASLDQHDALIRISADVGRYRDQWMRGPNWRGAWSRIFNWGSNAVNQWQSVGRETFEGRGDTEMTFVGLRGRHVDSIALMPVNADARCSRVEASFDNGRRQTLNINNGDYLRRGQYAQVDLPGNYRNLDSLYLRCQAVNAGRVEIALYTSH